MVIIILLNALSSSFIAFYFVNIAYIFIYQFCLLYILPGSFFIIPISRTSPLSVSISEIVVF